MDELPTPDHAAIHDDVRSYYRAAAVAGLPGGGAGHDDGDDRWGLNRYDTDTLADGNDAAATLSMGCGNPFAVAELHPGEQVLDLGSGAGLDVIVSAKRVSPGGRAYGVDFLPEMLEVARANAAEAGVDNATFLEGMIEDVPLPDGEIDVVISNCVINLAPDKRPVLAEMARVLKPGGRVAVSDVVADDTPTDAGPTPAGAGYDRQAWADCGAGALPRSEYLELLADVGLVDASIEVTHETGPGLHGAIIRATKPAAP